MMYSKFFAVVAFSMSAQAMKTAEEAELSNRKSNHTYGYAMYGFWGGVVFIGILRKILLQYKMRSSKKIETDTENPGNTIPQPYHTSIAEYWNRTYLTTPPALGTHHARLQYWCTIPTRIEAIVIVLYWILSIVLCGVGHEYYTGENPESITGTGIVNQRWENFANRCAVLAVSNLPILWMFSGRNNIFLWATGWSFGTFNIFHRHIARVVILQTIGHASAYTHLALITQLPAGVSLYHYDLESAWYIWGIVAATAMGAFWLTSISWLRRNFYEVFLLTHISLGILVIYAVFRHTTVIGGAFNSYLWPLVAIWSFDRLMRLVRIVACSLHIKYSKTSLQNTSAVAVYDPRSDVIKVQVLTSGLGVFKPIPGQHCFLYQPSSLRFWENHPFTVGSWSAGLPSSPLDEDSLPPSPVEKEHRIDSVAYVPSNGVTNGSATVTEPCDTNTLVFWIRPYDGWTRRLRDQCIKSPSNICHPYLLAEGPYGHSAHLHNFDTVVFIAGGTGISAVLPYIKDHVVRSHNGTSRSTDIRLAWSSRKANFVRSVCREELTSVLPRSDFKMEVFLTDEPLSSEESQSGAASLTREDKSDVLGMDVLASIQYRSGRPNLATVIGSAVQDLRASGRCAVFVCGPAAMADDARAATQAAMKAGARNLEYFEDSFGW